MNIPQINSEAAQAWLEAVLESSREAIIGMSLEGFIASWNSGAQKLFGYTLQEVSRREVKLFEPSNGQGESKKVINKIRRERRTLYYDTVCKRKDGSLLDVSVIASPVVLANKEIAGVSMILSDLAERKQIERLIREKNVILKEFSEQTDLEKRLIEERIVSNIDHSLMPLIRRLRQKDSASRQKIIELLEARIREITDSFGHNAEHKLKKLTPREMEICSLIREGFSTKEIGNLLNRSPLTVETLRSRIRKKIGLTKNSIHLFAHLKSF